MDAPQFRICFPTRRAGTAENATTISRGWRRGGEPLRVTMRSLKELVALAADKGKFNPHGLGTAYWLLALVYLVMLLLASCGRLIVRSRYGYSIHPHKFQRLVPVKILRLKLCAKCSLPRYGSNYYGQVTILNVCSRHTKWETRNRLDAIATLAHS